MPAPKKRQNPRIGSEFVKKYKKETYTLKVVKGSNGVAFMLDEKQFTSPSTAAKSITKGEVNGWIFWNMA